jgi:hypothetical protein
MDAVRLFRRSCPRRSVRTALSPAACPPASCDTGRAAARKELQSLKMCFCSGLRLFGSEQHGTGNELKTIQNYNVIVLTVQSFVLVLTRNNGSELKTGQGGVESISNYAWGISITVH